MPFIESLIGPLASIIDKVIPDKDARARAKLELLALEGTQELKQIEARLSAIVAEAQSTDPWTSRARPSFLYVMYALILFSMPMGVEWAPTDGRGPSAAEPGRLRGGCMLVAWRRVKFVGGAVSLALLPRPTETASAGTFPPPVRCGPDMGRRGTSSNETRVGGGVLS